MHWMPFGLASAAGAFGRTAILRRFAGRPTAAAAAGAKIDGAIQPETVVGKVHLNGGCLFQQVFVYNIGKSFNVENLVFVV